MIVVTGATGRAGGALARELSRRGVPFRMLVREPDRAPDLPGADVAVASYEDADALARALDPGDRAFMVSIFAPGEERLPLHRSFVDAAVARRVGRILYLSYVAADPEATFRHARSHGATEQMLRDSGLSWCAVRNAMYGDALADWFDDEGRITGPGGDGRVSFTLIDELAEATAALLEDRSHDHRERVTVTTPDSIDLAGLAALASEVTGDDYSYEPSDRETWIAFRRSRGRPDWSIAAGLSYYEGVARGEADVVGDDYRLLTGGDPTAIRGVVERHADELPLSRKERV